MGLWSWIIGKPTPRGARGGWSTNRGACSTSSSNGAVAVLDRPQTLPPDIQEEHQEVWWAPEGATLTEPVEPERPELTAEARALENLLVSHFDGHDLTLPPLLHVAEVLLPKLSDPNCDLGKVAAGLSEDQVVAAAVLRMANSPLYRGLNKITGIRPAVNRLGTRAVRMLLMHESLRAATFLHKKGQQGVNELAKSVWRRSLASACIMRSLAELTGTDQEEAFLVGLLHDIGNVVVLRIAFGAQFAPRYRLDPGVFEYLCYETHQEFGELVAKAWALPQNVASIVSDHHTHPAPNDPLRVPRLHVQLTDMIASLLGYAPYTPYGLLDSPAVRELQLAARPHFSTLLSALPQQLEETITFL